MLSENLQYRASKALLVSNILSMFTCAATWGAQHRDVPGGGCFFNSYLSLSPELQQSHQETVTRLRSCEEKETGPEKRERQRGAHPAGAVTYAALKKSAGISAVRSYSGKQDCLKPDLASRGVWGVAVLPCCCFTPSKSFFLESIYRRGARRWRKLYRVNGHLFQAKRFNRVSTVA